MKDRGLIHWRGPFGGRWHVAGAHPELLAPVLDRLERGSAMEGARLFRKTRRRKVFRLRPWGPDAPGIFVKQYSSGGLIWGLKMLLGAEPVAREVEAARALAEKGVATYEFLAWGWQGRIAGTIRSFLVTREIPRSEPLLDLLKRNGAETAGVGGPRSRTIEELAALLARLHQKGIHHRDLHGGNILVQDRCTALFPIDLKGARVRSRISKQKRDRDLAGILLSCRGLLQPEEESRVLEIYVRRTGFRPDARRLQRIRSAMERKRARSRSRRCLRNGTGFGRIRQRERTIFFNRAFPLERLEALLEQARAAPAGKGARVLKRSPETTITLHPAAADRATGPLCVKQYHPRGWADRVKYLFRRSRARRSWVGGWGLIVRGLRTPIPWVLVEQRRLGIPAGGVVVMDAVEGAEPLEQYAVKAFSGRARRDVGRRKRFAETLAAFFRSLHAGHVFHKDLKGTNLLIQERGPNWHIWLVDLDHIRFDRPLRRAERLMNLAQLNASVPDCVNRTDRLRFLRAYSEGADRDELRARASDILRISSKYRWAGVT